MRKVFGCVKGKCCNLMKAERRLKNLLGVIITLSCAWTYSAHALSRRKSLDRMLCYSLDASEHPVAVPGQQGIFRCAEEVVTGAEVQWLRDNTLLGPPTSKNHIRMRYKEHAMPPTWHHSRKRTSAQTSSAGLRTRMSRQNLSFLNTEKPLSHRSLPQQNTSVSESNDSTVLSNGSLRIHNITEKHAGIYRCFIQDQYGKILRRKFNLTVAKLPRCFLEPASQNGYFGGTARFHCRAVSALDTTYSWTKDDQLLQISDRRYEHLPNGVLQIFNLLPQDSGLYKCHVESDMGKTSSSSVKLAILPQEKSDGKLQFKYSPSNITVFPPYHSAIFECLVDGQDVTYGWIKQGGSICPAGSECVLGQSSHLNNLILRNISPKSRGYYTCIVRKRSSAESRKESTAFLEVLEKPVVKLIPPTFDPLALSESVQLTCRVKGNPPPAVHWIKDGVTLENLGGRKSRKDIASTSFFHISAIHREDAGYYQCIGENSAGTASAGTRLSIKTREKIPPPLNLTARAVSATEVFVQWHPPKYPGSITAYTVEYDSGHNTIPINGSRTNYTLKDLHPYTLYEIKVLAYTFKDTSEASEPIKIRTKESTPCGVVDHGGMNPLTVNSTTILLLWLSLPKLEQCGIIEKYKVIYGMENGDELLVEVPSRQLPSDESQVTEYALIGQLAPDVNYGLAVAPATSVGFGRESEFVDVTLPNVKVPSCEETGRSAFSLLMGYFQNDGKKLNVLWMLNSNNKVSTVNVTLELDGPIQSQALQSASANAIFTDVDPRKPYIVIVDLLDSTGLLCESQRFAVLPTERCNGQQNVPTNITAVAMKPRCITLTWSYHKDTALNITRFSIRYNMFKPTAHRKNFQYKNSTKLSATVCDLEPWSNYEFSVAAITNQETQYDENAYAKLTKIVRTLEEKPGFPTDFSCIGLELGEVECSWKSPLRPNGEILEYTLYHKQESERNWTSVTTFETFITLKCLWPQRLYAFKVLATNIAGDGRLSSTESIIIRGYNTSMVNCSFSFNEPAPPDNDINIKTIAIGSGIAAFCLIVCVILLWFFLPLGPCHQRNTQQKRSRKRPLQNGSSKSEGLVHGKSAKVKQNGYVAQNGFHQIDLEVLAQQKRTLLPKGSDIVACCKRDVMCVGDGYKQRAIVKRNGFHHEKASPDFRHTPNGTLRSKKHLGSHMENGMNSFYLENSVRVTTDKRKQCAVSENAEGSSSQRVVLSIPIPKHISKSKCVDGIREGREN